jgi:hypothetical protein
MLLKTKVSARNRGELVYQHYSREPPSGAFTVAVTTAATILTWLVTGLE